MKVLLFVDGPKGPKFAGYCGPLGEIPWQRRPVALKSVLGELGITSAQQREVESGRRWWLVECENAEAGRHVIAQHEYNGCPPGEMCVRACRVMCKAPVGQVLASDLASGGKP